MALDKIGLEKEGEEAPSPETPSSDDTTTAKSRSGPSGWQKWKVRKDNVTKAKWGWTANSLEWWSLLELWSSTGGTLS